MPSTRDKGTEVLSTSCSADLDDSALDADCALIIVSSGLASSFGILLSLSLSISLLIMPLHPAATIFLELNQQQQ